MPVASYTARLSANQNSNLSNGNHVEFNIDDGLSVASVSTGVGQANGLITMQRTGTFWIFFSTRMQINEGTCQLELYDHIGATPLLDIAGKPIRNSLTDNASTSFCEITGCGSIFQLNTGDIIKVEMVSMFNPVQVTSIYTTLTIMDLT